MNRILIEKDESKQVVLSVNKNTDESRIFNVKFDELKEYSKYVLEKVIKDGDFSYEIEVGNSELDLYKDTIKKITDSIKEDNDLHELFSENFSE